MPTLTKPVRRPSATDAGLLDLAPLLEGRHDRCKCPLCGFPRSEMLYQDIDNNDYVVFTCDVCRNDVRRADLVRRRKINPVFPPLD